MRQFIKNNNYTETQYMLDHLIIFPISDEKKKLQEQTLGFSMGERLRNLNKMGHLKIEKSL